MPLSRTPLLLLLACACNPNEGEPPSDTTDPIDSTVTVGDDDDDTVPVTTHPQEPGLWGRLVGADGAALPHYDVLACSSAFCLNGATAADGSFAFLIDPGTPIAFKTHEVLSHPARAAALTPCLIADGPSVDLGTVWVPDLPEGVALGATDPHALAVGDGLELTLNAADLVAPFGVFLFEVGATLIPAEYVPDYEALNGEEVLGVYAMYPFSTTSTSPVGVRVPTTLPAGTVANVRSIDYLDGRFSEPVVAISDGSVLATAPGEGVYALTHLVVTRP